MEIAN